MEWWFWLFPLGLCLQYLAWVVISVVLRDWRIALVSLLALFAGQYWVERVIARSASSTRAIAYIDYVPHLLFVAFRSV